MGAVVASGFHRASRIRQMVEKKTFLCLSLATVRPKPQATHHARRDPLMVAILSTQLLVVASLPLHAREHHRKVRAEDYGVEFSTEISAPESEVLEAVQEIVNDGIIQGSKEYNQDKYIEHAEPASSSPLFPEWRGPGKVFYKVRTGVLAPLHFKESKDEGTLAVRYVVQPKDASKTILRIDCSVRRGFPPHRACFRWEC